jgi:hypothetical protein
MEKETIALENYVYNISEDMYYVYVGITKNKENANKIVNHYKDLGYETIIKEYEINNSKFLIILFLNIYINTLLKYILIIA